MKVLTLKTVALCLLLATLSFISFSQALFLTATTNASAQRCGDSLFLFLRDREGRVIAPTDFESVKVSATYTVANVSELIAADPVLKELPTKVKSFSMRAECGIKQAQFRLIYKGEEMTIRVLNVPGDAGHILLEGITFHKGIFEVDIGNRPMKHTEKYEGVGSKAQYPSDEISWVIRNRSLKKIE